jgi:hypothetical protein
MVAVTHQTHYQYELMKQIHVEIERLKEALVNSHQIEGFDFSSYKHHVGRIDGLRTALELCEEVNAILNGKEKGD